MDLAAWFSPGGLSSAIAGSPWFGLAVVLWVAARMIHDFVDREGGVLRYIAA